jgi:hypothetical protein
MHLIDGQLATLVAHVRLGARLQQHASGVQSAILRCQVQRCVAILVRVMHIRARSHQRVNDGCVAVGCGIHERGDAIAVHAIHVCARLQQRSGRSDMAVGRSPPQRCRAFPLKCVGIRARCDLPLDLSNIAALRSVAQCYVRARHWPPAHTPRHADSLSLVAPPHANDGRVTGGGVWDCATRGRRACRAVSRTIASAGAAAHGRRRGDKTRPSAPGATRGRLAWAARARRRAGHTSGGGSGPARDRGGEIGPPPPCRPAIAPLHPPSRYDAHLLRVDERVGAMAVRWKCGRSAWRRRPQVRWG